MLKHLKTLPFTIILTVLIWLYAAAEFTSTKDDVSVRIQFQSTRPAEKPSRVIDQNGTPLPIVDLQSLVHFSPALPIPILINAPAEVLSNYRLDMSPNEVTIDVSGTPDDIARLRAAMESGSRAFEQPVRVYLDLSLADKPTDKPVLRPFRYVLPRGITLESKPDAATFRLIEAGPSTHP